MDTAADAISELHVSLCEVVASEPGEPGRKPCAAVLDFAVNALRGAVARGDHLAARCILAALMPLRARLYGPPQWRILTEVQSRCHLLLLALRVPGVPVDTRELDWAFEALDSPLDAAARKARSTWAADVIDRVLGFRLGHEDGWLVAEGMLRGRGTTHNEAVLNLAEMRRDFQNLRSKLGDPRPTRTAKELPFFGSLISDEHMTAVRFGDGGGSAALVGGKVTVVLPQKKPWQT